MRKLGITLAISVLVLIVAALAAPRFVDVNRYHDRIQAELSSKLGRQVSLGHMQLSLLPFSFRVDQLSIADDPKFQSARPFAVASQVSVSPMVRPTPGKVLRRAAIAHTSLSVSIPRELSGEGHAPLFGKFDGIVKDT